MPDRKDGRVKQLRIGPHALLALFQALGTHARISCDGLPADATVAGVGYDAESNLVCLLIRSATFPAVAPTTQVPDMQVTFTKHPTPQEQGNG